MDVGGNGAAGAKGEPMKGLDAWIEGDHDRTEPELPLCGKCGATEGRYLDETYGGVCVACRRDQIIAQDAVAEARVAADTLDAIEARMRAARHARVADVGDGSDDCPF